MTDNTDRVTAIRLTRTHERRLRAMYRSDSWPRLDSIEIELLVAGLLKRVQDGQGTGHWWRLQP